MQENYRVSSQLPRFEAVLISIKLVYHFNPVTAVPWTDTVYSLFEA
jgi:hypothetical protein